MATIKRRYPKEEFARRGDAIYESDILPRLQPTDEGKFVAIDIESGSYEIDADEMAACDHLNARIPDAQTWMVRVGYRYVHRFGTMRLLQGIGRTHAMTAENFDQMLIALRSLKPYRVFTVELNGGRRFEVDHPEALVIRDGVAVFMAPGGVPNWFDHESINKIIGAPANTPD